MTNTINNILSVNKLNKSYKDNSKETIVLKDLDLNVPAGETIAIMGASGCGKSTLLHCLAGLDHFQSGQVKLLDKDITALSEKDICALRNDSVGFIYQFHHLLPEFNVLENVLMPLWLNGQKRLIPIMSMNY